MPCHYPGALRPAKKTFFLTFCLGAVNGLFANCASLAPEKSATDLTSLNSGETNFAAVPATSNSGDVAYKTAAQRLAKVEWITCKLRQQAATASFVVMHGDRAGFAKDGFCAGWLAQAFLSQGYDVITVNRPGFGKSSGPSDLVGPDSLLALKAGLNAAQASGKVAAPIGVWGYSTGATAAGLVSKHIKGLQLAVLGGGVYDFDETKNTSQDRYLQAEIKMIQQAVGDDALADRSLAYDISGLPKTIILYHGKQDTSTPLAQAEALRDSLASSEHKVSLETLATFGHEIPWLQHRKLLVSLLGNLPKSQ